MSRSGALISTWAIDELKKHLKPNMKVVIVGFSFFGNLSKEKYLEYYGKDSEYALKMNNLFATYNIKDVNWVYYYNMTKTESIDLISKADILYFPGGAPDLMYERIVEKQLLDVIKQFNKIIIGSSAGAMIQLAQFHISPDKEYHKFSTNKGLGYLNNFFIEVHYARRRKQKSSMRKMRKKHLKPVYTIPDDGMVIVTNNNIKTLGSARLHYTAKGINKKNS